MIRRAVLLLLLAVLLLPATAAAERRYLDEVFSGVHHIPDVKYGKADALRMDLRRPAGDTAEGRPAIVWMHGGGFRTGSKDDLAAYADAFALRGYVTAAIGYRLRPKGPSNQELLAQFLLGEPPVVRDARHDLQAAVRYLRANAIPLGIDADRIVVGGHSAGAIASLGAAFTPDDPGDAGTMSPEVAGSGVAAAISLAGAWDPRAIRGPVPPVQLFHGTADLTVPYALAETTCLAVRAAEGTCELTAWAGEGHDVAERRVGEVVPAAAEFLCRVLLDGCPAVATRTARPDLRPARALGAQAGRRLGQAVRG